MKHEFSLAIVNRFGPPQTGMRGLQQSWFWFLILSLVSFKPHMRPPVCRGYERRRAVQCCGVNGDTRYRERHDGVGPERRDVKRRCEEDRHTRRRDTPKPQRRETWQKQELSVWRSLMSLQFLSTTAGTGVRQNQCVCVWEYPPLKHWAAHNLSDSCQLCTSIYSASQIQCQRGAQPAGMTATETV